MMNVKNIVIALAQKVTVKQYYTYIYKAGVKRIHELILVENREWKSDVKNNVPVSESSRIERVE